MSIVNNSIFPISQERIEEIITAVPEDKVSEILDKWEDLSPERAIRYQDVLSYAIAAYPKFAKLETEAAIELLLTGPETIEVNWTPEDALNFYRIIKGEENVQLIKQIMDNRLKCPDSYKNTTGWLELVGMYNVLIEMEDDAHVNLFDSVSEWIDNNSFYLL